MCVFYYCRTYYKAVRVGGERRVEDMCYERRRAEACVDESAHHALVMVCVLLLQDLLQSCPRGGGRRVEDMCYGRRRAEACVDVCLGLRRRYFAEPPSPTGPRKVLGTWKGI